MRRLAVLCALLASACGEELAAPALVACGQLSDGHWDSRLIIPGAAGVTPSVAALVRMTDGAVIAAGRFSAMSGVAARNIARWDGTRWSALADGLPGQVISIAVDDRGQLWAVGNHDVLDVPVDKAGAGTYLARWSGAQWTYVVHHAFTIRGVTAVDGGVAVYGSFFGTLELPGSTVAIWRDGVWSSTGLVNGGSATAALRDGAGLCVAGNLQTQIKEFAFGVSCWDGAAWEPLGVSAPTQVSTLARGNDGTWFAGGFLQVFEEGNQRYGIVRLDADGTWRSLDGGVFGDDDGLFQPEVTSIFVDGDDLVVAGHFEWAGVPRQRAYHLARWSPVTKWSAMTPPGDLFGRLSTVLADGTHTYVGGAFRRIGLAPGAGIASVDAGVARPVPDATLAAARLGAVSDLAVLPDGLVLAGQFKDARDLGDIAAPTYNVMRFDGAWDRPVEGLPADSATAVVAIDRGYAVRAGEQLYRRYGDRQLQLVTDQPVHGPIVADASGRVFFVVPTTPESTIVQTTREDTSFFATIPGVVIAMTIYDGDLVVVTANEALGAQSVYRRREDDWELIGAWADYTVALVVSPALGLVAGTSMGLRVWNGSEWRMISRAPIYDVAACSDGIVAAIDDGDGSRLAFLDDPDGDWTYYGEPRGAQTWQIAPTERGIYVGTSYFGVEGSGPESPLGFARWTTLDDSGW